MRRGREEERRKYLDRGMVVRVRKVQGGKVETFEEERERWVMVTIEEGSKGRKEERQREFRRGKVRWF